MYCDALIKKEARFFLLLRSLIQCGSQLIVDYHLFR
nr:MAG TPA: hypothetical protein [Caudoviricetes sp.]